MLPHGIVASSVTPFTPDGDVAFDRIQASIDWLVSEGVDGISPLGSAGEFAALEIETRKQVLEHVLAAYAGRGHTMVGTHHYSTRKTIELSKHAEKSGADSLLITPPYYGGPPRAAILDHYRAVASAVSLPIVLYHNTAASRTDIPMEDVALLFSEGAIAGIKLSNTDGDRVRQILALTGGELTVYAGIDLIAFEGLCFGAHGWISGLPSMVPRAARRLYDAVCSGDLNRATEEWKTLVPLARFQFANYLQGGDRPHWLSVVKGALNLVGPPVGDPCPPLRPLSPLDVDALAELVQAVGYEVRR